MSLTPGTRIGPYEVVARLGAGGMGEVFRARDTKLGRDVALKVLPAAFASDPDRLMRFEREARTLAALNHPHIAQVYGLEDVPASVGVGPARALVLELVDGDDLSARIARGPIPLDEVLAIARQIADALEAAHEQGIIHRDLKPANIKVRPDGTVKVLDFGLAKAVDPRDDGDSSGGPALANSPTITSPAMTQHGVILGTAAYMAPEQAKGRPATKRSDIWAFGAVLYEMLTGTRTFGGADLSDTLAAVLRADPDWTRLPASTPEALRRLLRRCLEKSTEQRLAHAADARLDLAEARDAASTPARVPQARPISGVGWVVVGLLFAAAAAATAAAVLGWRRPEPGLRPVQFRLPAPPGATFATPVGGGTGTATQLAVAPDGRHVAFVASDQSGVRLWLRPIAAAEASPLPGTEGAAFPFWSPDGRQLGFFAGGKLKRLAIAGGPPITVCDAPAGRGGTWNRDQVIVFAPSTSGGLQRVPAGGGQPVEVSAVDADYGETNHRFPQFLPDGRHFVYTAVVGTCCPASKPGRLRVGSLDGDGTVTVLQQAESSAVYANGHLLYGDEVSGALMARPFDAVARRFSGDAVPIADEVGTESSRYASLSTSETGVLAYARGGFISRPTQLTWFDRSGQALRTVGDQGAIAGMALSHDERTVAIAAGVAQSRDLFFVDLASGERTRFTFDTDFEISPVWSPDDRWLMFGSRQSGRQFLRRKLVAGTVDAETLVEDETQLRPSDWSRLPETALYDRLAGTAFNMDVWTLLMGSGAKPSAVLQARAVESDGKFSPDGRWLAYQRTDQAGIPGGIYVQPYPPTGGVFQVSAAGAYRPVWSADGREVFYIDAANHLTAALVDTRDGFRTVSRTTLFAINTLGPGAVGGQYAVSRDGRRILVNVAQQLAATTPIDVLLDWPAMIRP